MKKIFLLSSLLIVFSTELMLGQPVKPQETGNNYSFQVGNVYMEINPAIGGRIVSLKLNDKQILYTNTTNGGNWGSTFWPSPQAPWSWPPISELDNRPYSGGIKVDSVNIVSSLSSMFSLKFRKIITANLADTSITIDYYMINGGSTETNVAPWEVTRVPVGGMIFFPDSGSCSGPLTSVFTKIGNLQWYDQTSNTPANSTKLMANTKEGWIGWLNPDSAVFIKQYPNIQKSDAAQGEEEVEYYYNGPGTYWELENQGKLVTLKPGDSVKWTVKWYIRKLPVNVDKSKGSVALANFVRKTIGLDTPNSNAESSINSKKETTISISPNPANNTVIITGLNEPYNIKLTDVNGKIVLIADINNGNNSLNTNYLKEGMYFYKISCENRNLSGRLIIKR
jgi:hypothetical protein